MGSWSPEHEQSQRSTARCSNVSTASSSWRLSSCRESLLVSAKDPEEIFLVRSLLGEGSYGLVYLASLPNSGKEDGASEPVDVAIKVVPCSVNAEKELRILKDLQHPSIVQYFGTWVKDNQLWIAMEFCEGGSVCDAMGKLGRGLHLQEIRAITAGALRGLEYLHDMNVMHRDIKGDNILLTAHGAKLADFGVSARITGQYGRRGTITGTPYWMAPEVCGSGTYDVTADTWSFGITLIEMVLTLPPLADLHPTEAMAQIRTRLSPLDDCQLPDSLDPVLKDFISCCLCKEPLRRPSCKELLVHKLMSDAAEHEADDMETLQELIHGLCSPGSPSLADADTTAPTPSPSPHDSTTMPHEESHRDEDEMSTDHQLLLGPIASRHETLKGATCAGGGGVRGSFESSQAQASSFSCARDSDVFHRQSRDSDFYARMLTGMHRGGPRSSISSGAPRMPSSGNSRESTASQDRESFLSYSSRCRESWLSYASQHRESFFSNTSHCREWLVSDDSISDACDRCSLSISARESAGGEWGSGALFKRDSVSQDPGEGVRAFGAEFQSASEEGQEGVCEAAKSCPLATLREADEAEAQDQTPDAGKQVREGQRGGARGGELRTCTQLLSKDKVVLSGALLVGDVNVDNGQCKVARESSSEAEESQVQIAALGGPSRWRFSGTHETDEVEREVERPLNLCRRSAEEIRHGEAGARMESLRCHPLPLPWLSLSEVPTHGLARSVLSGGRVGVEARAALCPHRIQQWLRVAREEMKGDDSGSGGVRRGQGVEMVEERAEGTCSSLPSTTVRENLEAVMKDLQETQLVDNARPETIMLQLASICMILPRQQCTTSYK